jgi:MFS family permease
MTFVATRPVVDTASLQKRTVLVLMLAQVLGSLGVGASLTVGTGLIIAVSDNPAISGLAATMGTLGAAVAGIPLARLAMRLGRRFALASGNLVAVLGAGVVILGGATRLLVFIMLGLVLMGFATAAQLQSRFAATDLASPQRRGRDLSLVVWSVTLGAVMGPNLVGPGEVLGSALGMPFLTGAFLITGAAQILATLIIVVFLRPDPLLTAQDDRVAAAQAAPEPAKLSDTQAVAAAAQAVRNVTQQRAAIAVIAIAQAVMVAIMAMTPAHLSHHGYSITVIGFTISLHIAGMFALAPVFGLLADRYGNRAIVIFGIAQLLLATAFTGFGGENAVLIQIGLVLLGTGWSAVTVAGSAMLTANTPAALRTKRQGQSDSLMNLAGASAGALAGVAFALGGFPALSSISAALTLGILALTLMVFSSPALAKSDTADEATR